MSAQSVLELDWPEEAEACAEISPQDMTVHECIATVEHVTLIQTRLAGVKSAVLARIGELQKSNEGELVPLGSAT